MSNTEEIRNELVNINNSKYTGNQLWFDPIDGNLKILPGSRYNDNNEKPSPDSQVMDQIAEGGFFV